MARVWEEMQSEEGNDWVGISVAPRVIAGGRDRGHTSQSRLAWGASARM